MRALVWKGINELGVETVKDPTLLNPHDAIIKVKLSSVCGSDLHLLDGYVPSIHNGDIIGHEFIGEVVETGPQVRGLKRGDRVVVGSVIGCGECYYCRHDAWSLCDNSNPHAWMADAAFGYSGAGIFGYSHAFGGYAGSHAEYIRVPYADKGAFPAPEGISDEQLLFCSDAFPTGYMAADMCGDLAGKVVAIWGCGGVGQMAIRSAWLLGAARVVAIDRIPGRLAMAQNLGQAEVINYEETDVLEALKEMTAGRGPDCCIDAVGMEPAVLRQAIMACGKGGIVAVAGVYAGVVNKFPMGAVMNKGLTLRSGQAHAQKYIPRLLEHILKGDADPSFLLTHRWPLEQGPEGYKMFKEKSDHCMRVAFDPAR
ncbi:MAG TPA: zinc-dependent alcohol dehydrogenase [Chitinophaga sp.]